MSTRSSLEALRTASIAAPVLSIAAATLAASAAEEAYSSVTGEPTIRSAAALLSTPWASAGSGLKGRPAIKASTIDVRNGRDFAISLHSL